MPLAIFSQSCKEAAMPQKIGRLCSSLEYILSTCNGVKLGGIIAKKLASLFHIPSKIHTVCLDKIPFSCGKICGYDKLKIFVILPAYLGTK